MVCKTSIRVIWGEKLSIVSQRRTQLTLFIKHMTLDADVSMDFSCPRKSLFSTHMGPCANSRSVHHATTPPGPFFLLDSLNRLSWELGHGEGIWPWKHTYACYKGKENRVLSTPVIILQPYQLILGSSFRVGKTFIIIFFAKLQFHSGGCFWREAGLRMWEMLRELRADGPHCPHPAAWSEWPSLTMRVSTAAQAGPTPTRAWVRQRSEYCIVSVSQEKRFSLRQEIVFK